MNKLLGKISVFLIFLLLALFICFWLADDMSVRNQISDARNYVFHQKAYYMKSNFILWACIITPFYLYGCFKINKFINEL
jgi:hypothetical protein